MAVQVQEVWSDLDHRFVQDSLGNLKKVVNVASVMTSIDNILRTYKSERVMLASFASNLRNMVFESMDPTLMKFLSREVKESIEIWDPRVEVLEVAVVSDPDNSTFSLTVDFNIRGQENIYQYEEKFKRG